MWLKSFTLFSGGTYGYEKHPKLQIKWIYKIPLSSYEYSTRCHVFNRDQIGASSVFSLFSFCSFFFLSLLMGNHTGYFICVRKGRMFCWLFHHVWKIKCCQNLHWTYFLKKSRLNYIKPQGSLVTVEKSVCSFYYTSRLECPYLPRISLLYYTAFWILFNILISNYNFFSICEILETRIKSFETVFYLSLYIYQSLRQNSLNLKYLYMKGTDSVDLEKCRRLIASQLVLISLCCWDMKHEMALITKS